jgi:hypothetical protein
MNVLIAPLYLLLAHIVSWHIARSLSARRGQRYGSNVGRNGEKDYEHADLSSRRQTTSRQFCKRATQRQIWPKSIDQPRLLFHGKFKYMIIPIHVKEISIIIPALEFSLSRYIEIHDKFIARLRILTANYLVRPHSGERHFHRRFDARVFPIYDWL